MGESSNLLMYLAESGAAYKEIELSTIQIAKGINSTQQTVSRKLMELEKNNLIERTASTRGIKIRIKDQGLEKIKKVYLSLKNVFDEKIQSLNGTVVSGLGEGSYYTSLPNYVEQFKKKLSFIPYKGTLNLKVDYTEFLQFISSQQKIRVDGFETLTRTFGSIAAYKIKIKGIEAAIITPERTSHKKDMIEIISETYIRKKFNLKDGDTVKVSM